jgi:hypothetical protein
VSFMTSIDSLLGRPLSPDDQPLPIGDPAQPAAGPASGGEDDPPSFPFVLAGAPGQYE